MSREELTPVEALAFAPHMKKEFHELTRLVRKLLTMTGIDLFPFLSNVEFPVSDEPVEIKLDIRVLE